MDGNIRVSAPVIIKYVFFILLCLFKINLSQYFLKYFGTKNVISLLDQLEATAKFSIEKDFKKYYQLYKIIKMKQKQKKEQCY